MADNNKLELVVEVDVNKANASIKSINSGLSSMEQAAVKAGTGASGGIDAMTRSMAKGVAAGELLVEGLKKVVEWVKEWTIEAARSAANLERMEAVTKTVAKSFGIADEAALGAVEAIKKIGYTTEEAQGAVQKLIVSELGLGKSEGLAKMAKDAAAFSTTGVKASEAMEDVLRAVETGQSRGLRSLNIFVDLNKVTEHAELLAQLHGKTLDENEIKEVRYNAIVEAAAKLKGSAAAAAGSLKAEEAALGRELEALKDEVGKEFVGWLKDTVHWATEGVKWLKEHKDGVIKFAEGVGVAAGLLITYQIAETIIGITTAVEGLTLALALNPWALAITGVVAAGAIIYKTWSDTQANLERGYEEMRRKNIQQQMMAGKMNAEDVMKMGYSERDVKEILLGKRLLPGEKFDDFSKLDLGFGLKIKGLDKPKPKEATNDELRAQIADRKTALDAQRTASDYAMRATEERTGADRDLARARLEDSMKIIAATNSEAQATIETTRAERLAVESQAAGELKLRQEETREIDKMRTRIDDKTGAVRRITLTDKTLTDMHRATADKIEAFDKKWNEDEARRLDALFQAAMARAERRFETEITTREQQAQWQGNVVDPNSRDAMVAAVEERKKAQLAPLAGLNATTEQQKLQIENAKTRSRRTPSRNARGWNSRTSRCERLRRTATSTSDSRGSSSARIWNWRNWSRSMRLRCRTRSGSSR